MTLQEIMVFFRMGLVTGLVSKQAVIAWADRRLVEGASPEQSVIDLALSSSQPISQVVWLLNQLQGGASPDLPARLVCALAAGSLGEDGVSLDRVVMGLRLLLAEYRLPDGMRRGLVAMEDARLNDPAALAALTQAFLSDYLPYQQQAMDILRAAV